MDSKVCGKLLTLHRRGNGVDVEALHDRIPLRQIAEKGPRWDLTGIEVCGGGKVVSWLPLMFLGYKGIYRWKKYVGWAPWGPRGSGARLPPLGAPSCLVASSLLSWRPLQVSWIMFVPKITLPKVSFRLDSVLYSFSAKHWNRQKKNSNLQWASG